VIDASAVSPASVPLRRAALADWESGDPGYLVPLGVEHLIDVMERSYRLLGTTDGYAAYGRR
jgi:hypothetical protein